MMSAEEDVKGQKNMLEEAVERVRQMYFIVKKI